MKRLLMSKLLFCRKAAGSHPRINWLRGMGYCSPQSGHSEYLKSTPCAHASQLGRAASYLIDVKVARNALFVR